MILEPIMHQLQMDMASNGRADTMVQQLEADNVSKCVCALIADVGLLQCGP